MFETKMLQGETTSMSFRAVALSGLLIVSACGSVNVTPPVQSNLEKTRTVPMPFEGAWTRSVDWFATNNITIDKIEKPSGLITAKYTFSVDETLLDCGDIKMSGVLQDPTIERFGTLNVTVRGVSASTSQVTANCFGEFHAVGLDAWDARPVVAEGRCVSTGVIEQQFLDFVSA